MLEPRLDAHFDATSGMWSGVDANPLRYQVGRLSGLPKYPREVAGQRELAIVMLNCANMSHVTKVIDEILSGWKECPVPAELRELVAKYRPPAAKKFRCQNCGGGRYVSAPYLATYPSHWPAMGVTPQMEPIRATWEEAYALAERLPGNQTIVSVAVRCEVCS